MKKNRLLKNMIFASLFIAIAFVLPFLTGQIPEIGSMLCPMHIPVLICGFICGWKWGLLVGLIFPLLRSLILGMPPLFPTAFCMAIELGVYGLLTGLLYNIFPKKKIYVYCSLVISMIIGRIVWGVAMLIVMSVVGDMFTFNMFIVSTVVNALPGIILQIILVPILVMLLENKELVKEKV